MRYERAFVKGQAAQKWGDALSHSVAESIMVVAALGSVGAPRVEQRQDVWMLQIRRHFDLDHEPVRAKYRGKFWFENFGGCRHVLDLLDR